jgi:hypothetical protein
MKHHESGKGIELRYVQTQLEAIKNEAVQRRVENTLLWYIRKANRSRMAYYATTIISIAASAAIPVLNTLSAKGASFSLKDTLISGIAAVGGIAVSVCTLFNFKEAWNRNRKYAEGLKHECFLYETHISPYDKADADEVFIQRLENLSAEESQAWGKSNLGKGIK